MGAQVIGEKKRKLAEQKTGLTIERLLRLDNHCWEARIPVEGGHQHVRIDPSTWESSRAPASKYGGCWTTCSTPRVDSA